MHRCSSPRPPSARLSFLGTAFLTLLAACSGNERGNPPDGGALGDDEDGSTANLSDGGAGADGGRGSDGGNPLSVDPGSDLCNIASLPVKPAGCECEVGAKVGCWTGKPGDRGRGECHDGLQTCEGSGEFGSWGPCEGEVQECGDTDAGPPPAECGCVPGTVITCSEDCSELIICSLTGTKVCQPDGTWSRCREGNLGNLVNLTDLCRNVFFGCLAQNYQGVFLGACDDAFTCGHPPGLLPDLPAGPSGSDGGTPADSGAGGGIK